MQAKVLLEGKEISALLDTGSPVSIVSLEHLLGVWARDYEASVTSEQWQHEVEERLQPSQLELHNYGGGTLNIVGQDQVELSVGGETVTPTLQVHVGAPMPLLLGTDLLPTLGVQFGQKSSSKPEDLFTANDYDANSTKSGPVETTLDSAAGPELVVCNVNVTRLPPRHAKLVPVQADPDSCRAGTQCNSARM